MKRLVTFLLCFILVASLTEFSNAGGYGAASYKEMEQAGLNASKPSIEDIHKAVNKYIKEKVMSSGAFELFDPQIVKTRRLKLIMVYDEIGEAETYYYSNADFKDMDTGDLLNLDMNVVQSLGNLRDAAVIIRKVNGKERFDFTGYRAPSKK